MLMTKFAAETKVPIYARQPMHGDHQLKTLQNLSLYICACNFFSRIDDAVQNFWTAGTMNQEKHFIGAN